MKLRIHLIARPSFDVNMFLRFLRQSSTRPWIRTAKAQQAEELIEVAGRVCYMAFGRRRQRPRTNRAYIQHLIQQGHESVFEHVNWTFVLSGVSRAFTHQLVRHRVGFAFSQLSQQYHDESLAEFIPPTHLKDFPKAMASWRRATNAARRAYRDIRHAIEENVKFLGPIEKKNEAMRAVRSAARSVLPNATETKVVMTVNARALRYFLKVRGAILGDTEMRAVAAELLRIVRPHAPALFSDFHIKKLSDGSKIILQNSPPE